MVTRWAQRHAGIVTREQALSLGANDRVLARLVRSAALRRCHPGVYILAGTPAGHATAVRAGLAALGPDAVASHQSAAWLAGLVEQPPAVVHAVVGAEQRCCLSGVQVHRCNQPVAVQAFRGVRCTSPVRTLIDLATVVPAEAVAAALDRALASRLVRLRDLDDATRAGGGVRGTAVLRRCLQQRGYVGGPGPSVLESRMARLFTRYRLPKPRAEVVWGEGREYRLDFAYPAIKLAIEVYGYAWHHSPDQLAHDLARQRRLVSGGWTVLAYTWRQVAADPHAVAAEISTAYRRLSAAA